MKLNNEDNKVECPHCKGEKGRNILVTPEWKEPPEYEWEICRTCQGKGKVRKLQAAVYEARGGPEPIKFRGYA